MMTNDLIISISKQLNIPKSDDYKWIAQIVYSVAGQMALASLWDHCGDNDSISIQHFKNRIEQIFDAYEDIFPETGFLFPKDKTPLSDEIYSIYLKNGFFYHSPHKISPAAPAIAGYEDMTLYRGISPDAELFMSGLGFYSIQKKSIDRSIENMFGLQEYTFDCYLDELLDHAEWKSVDWPDDVEFLRLDPPFTKGYWKKNPLRDNRISLVRYGNPNKIFALYRYYNGSYQQKAVSEWRIRDHFSSAGGYGEYRRIAIALLKRYRTLPDIETKLSGNLMEIKLGYRLPPSEEEFFKLYSWPIWYDFDPKAPQIFTRKMTKQIYPMFKYTLESIGYSFKEE